VASLLVSLRFIPYLRLFHSLDKHQAWREETEETCNTGPEVCSCLPHPATYEATVDGQVVRWTARDPEPARLKLTRATQSIVARRGPPQLGTVLLQGPEFRAPRHDGLKMATRAGRQRAWVCLAVITDAATTLFTFRGTALHDAMAELDPADTLRQHSSSSHRAVTAQQP